MTEVMAEMFEGEVLLGEHKEEGLRGIGGGEMM